MAIIDVHPGSPTAIQDAVNAAGPGDVIVVHNGVYHESVNINKSNIRLIAGNTNQAILDGENTRPQAFSLFDSSGVEIRGFTIRNYTTFGILSTEGGQITGGFHRFVNNIIQDILNEDGIRTETNGNLLWRNTVTRTGRDGIRIEQSSNSNRIIGNVLHHNRADGVSIGGGDNAIIQNRIFKNNNIGISSNSANFSINTLVFKNDIFENSNGVLATPSNWVIIDNNIRANRGAGIRIPFGSFNTFIAYNNIERNTQSGININEQFNSIENNEIEGNRNNGLFLRSTPGLTSTGNFIYRNKFDNNQPRNIQDLGVDNNYLENKVKN